MLHQNSQESNTFTFLESKANAIKYVRNLPDQKISRMGCHDPDLFKSLGVPPEFLRNLSQVRNCIISDVERDPAPICLVRDGKVWGIVFLFSMGNGCHEVGIASSTPGGAELLMKELRQRHPEKRLLARVSMANRKSVQVAMLYCDDVISNLCWMLHKKIKNLPPAMGVIKHNGEIICPPDAIWNYDKFVLDFLKVAA